MKTGTRAGRLVHVGALALLAAVGAGVVWLALPAGPLPVAIGPVPASTAAPAAMPASADADTGSRIDAATAAVDGVAPVRCRDDSLQILRAGIAEPVCAGPAEGMRNGVERRHRYPLSAGGSLTIITVGAAITSIMMDLETGLPLHCDGDDCAGAALTAPDLEGRQTITLDGVRLRAAATAADDARISARLRTRSDLPCEQPALTIGHADDGRLERFCPDGGHGTVWDEAGNAVHRFRDLDGRTLELALAADGTVRHLRYDGRECLGPSCMGVLPTVAGGLNEVQFSGTPLGIPTHDSRSLLTIDGVLRWPAEPDQL